ncbi:hypothetical protein NDU88_004230, partial [Pleurodeles waltl]
KTQALGMDGLLMVCHVCVQIRPKEAKKTRIKSFVLLEIPRYVLLSIVLDSFRASILVPLHKKGSRLLPTNYTNIALLDVEGKRYAQLLNDDLETWTKEKQSIPRFQTGFLRYCNIEDNLLTMACLIDEALLPNARPLNAAFIDFMNAFDNIPRSCL